MLRGASSPPFYSSSSSARWRLPTGHNFARTANVFATASSLRAHASICSMDGSLCLDGASAGLAAVGIHTARNLDFLRLITRFAWSTRF
jgi:hypothetical protein